ncbi:hypothetical protein O6H91_18G004800 [Diphasiastrum complanatum]|uniref:Uncharacterized protein n=1 Tax=Diphasiastrum complanatum TaxID=34168 RepID=A0ACC2AXS2_DIPCM|nr:hypothetical protein O6H91_18G004800 [Diphasiastrum complanatum]
MATMQHCEQMCAPAFSFRSASRSASVLFIRQQRLVCTSLQLPSSRECAAACRFASFLSTIEHKFQGPGIMRMECVFGGAPEVTSRRLNVMCQASSDFRGPQPSELMLVSDLDFTMVDHNEPSHAALLRFSSLWEAEYAQKSLLVYSTGRSPEKFEEICKHVPLLTPDIAILSVGTEIRYGTSLQIDSEWETYLNDGWDREIIVQEAKKFLELSFQEDSEQRPHKVSFKVEKKDAQSIIDRLSPKLKEYGLKVKLIYSGSIDLDVVPLRAGKGEALAYILEKAKAEKWAPNNVLVCGDSGNDIELFAVEGVNGVIVENAHEELVKWYESQPVKTNICFASHRCAGGIIQALQHFGLGPHTSPRESIGQGGISWPNAGDSQIPNTNSPQREVVEFNVLFEKWLTGELPTTAATFERLKQVIAKKSSMVYPWGVERNLYDSVCLAQSKHGSMSGKNFLTWIDCIKEHQLAEGVYIVTWQSWEQSSGNGRKGYYVTAILLAKEGTPNGVEWFRVHETVRMID